MACLYYAILRKETTRSRLRRTWQAVPAQQLKFPVAIVCPICEYASWLLASLTSLEPYYKWTRPIQDIIATVPEPEAECSAKGILRRNLPHNERTYQETDQARMTAQVDLQAVKNQCRSFRRLIHAV